MRKMSGKLSSVVLVVSVACLLFGTNTGVLGQRSDETDLDTVIEDILKNDTLLSFATTPADTTTPVAVQPCDTSTSLCVPHRLCGDGEVAGNTLDLKNGNNPCDYTHVCCLYQDIHEERVPEMTSFEVPTTPPVITSNSNTGDSDKPVNTHTPTTTTNHNNDHLGCGVRHKDGLTFRITNARDNEAEFAEFPWMVALFEEAEVLGQRSHIYKCGGSLIHPKVVLTATHCVNKKRTIMARAGEWDMQTEHEIIPSQDRKVTEIVLHEGFHRGGLFNDIALLILETPFFKTDNIGFACLPRADMNFDMRTCTASGWGAHNMTTSEQTILKKIDLPVVAHATCQEQFRTLRKTNDYDLHPSYLCAGGKQGQDTCKGDGGSPLVCPLTQRGDQYVQAGIVSWGRGCGSAQAPGVYANVAHLRHWVDSKMSERGLETSYYDSY